MTEHNGKSPQSKKWWQRPLLWIGLAIAATLLVTISVMSMRATAHSLPNPSDKSSLLAIVTNSGSTNTPEAILTLNTDGSGALVYQANSRGYSNKTFPPGTFDIAQLQHLLVQIGDVSAIPDHECLKSISFGSTTTITFEGKTSGDVSCLSNADQQTYLDVKKEVQRLYAQAVKS